MARNTYVLLPTKSSGPMLKIRNADNRNQRRLNKRVERFAARHGRDNIQWIRLENGTLVVYTLSSADTFTVKREAERAARKSGRFMYTIHS